MCLVASGAREKAVVVVLCMSGVASMVCAQEWGSAFCVLLWPSNCENSEAIMLCGDVAIVPK